MVRTEAINDQKLQLSCWKLIQANTYGSCVVFVTSKMYYPWIPKNKYVLESMSNVLNFHEVYLLITIANSAIFNAGNIDYLRNII